MLKPEMRPHYSLTSFLPPHSPGFSAPQNTITAIRDYKIPGTQHASMDSLAWYVLKELNFNLNDVFMGLEKFENPTLEVNDLDERPPDKEEYRKLWQDWTDREEELYQNAFSIVNQLTALDLERIIGAIGQAILEACKVRYHDMANPLLPEVLKRNPTLAIYRLNDDKCLISGPSGFFEIRSELAEVLPYFDGKKSNAEVNRIIREDCGASLPSELLISLYQNRILVS